MRGNTLLATGSAIIALITPNYSVAQASISSADLPQATEQRDDILVVGIRRSVAAATEKKRRAKQIVDSVVAEDVGKLPDNNVPEAISRITGVQILRERGKGQSISIRGLDDVQTTINGNNVNLGVDRSINLADVPAELLKAVDVYKTRTPDQIEGSIAGTVNVELRRPLDFEKRLTVAGSARAAYNNVAKKASPFLGLLVADRFDLGDGEAGVLVNASWTRNFYRETYIDSESPDRICCGTPTAPTANTTLARLPANLRSVIVPYRAQYGLEEGHVTRPSVNAVAQWAPTPNLNFVLEGQYIGSKELRQEDRLYALMREGNLTLSNISLQPDGVTVNKLDVAGVVNRLPVGIDSIYRDINSDFYSVNFGTHWETGIATLNAGVQYSWSDVDSYFVEHLTRPIGLKSATIDFRSPIYKGGLPTITLNGVDLSSPANYGVERFQDNSNVQNNKERVAHADLTLKTSEQGLVRSLQFGARYSGRDLYRQYGYRDGYPRTGQVVKVDGVNYPVFTPLVQFPGGDQASLASPPIGGVTPWYRIPGPVVRDHITDVLTYILARDPRAVAKTLFTTERPLPDQGQNFTSNENTFAFYAMANYGFDIGFPIDGVIGARYVNTWGTYDSVSYRVVFDPNRREVIEPSNGRGNFTDILPSATAILHFTPKAQLRLSYSTNVQRVPFYSLRPFYYVEPSAAQPNVDAGNPDLKAQRDHAFDVSAEYYFGRGGMLSLAGFYKKASNFLFRSREPANDLSAYGLPGRSGFISQQRNAGDGTFAGVEGAAQTTFSFMPGFFRNFGASANASHLFKARVEYPYPESFPGAFDSPGTSKWTANGTLFYDTPVFSARASYNYRSPYRMFVWEPRPDYSWYMDATSSLDAAVNVTPVKFLTLSVEGTNLLGNDNYSYFGRDNLLPRGVRIRARGVQASARFRF